jgi:O-acetylhomoserine/O-acetylserine sulfhydrylase-like pyridoxal-dependent enzyme
MPNFNLRADSESVKNAGAPAGPADAHASERKLTTVMLSGAKHLGDVNKILHFVQDDKVQ